MPDAQHAAGSQAKAVIHVGKLDSAGNWPLKVDVENLPELPKGQYYEMFLSRGADQRAASCGTFRVRGLERRHPAERAVPARQVQRVDRDARAAGQRTRTRSC